jgi:hypothetical protein
MDNIGYVWYPDKFFTPFIFWSEAKPKGALVTMTSLVPSLLMGCQISLKTLSQRKDIYDFWLCH